MINLAAQWMRAGVAGCLILAAGGACGASSLTNAPSFVLGTNPISAAILTNLDLHGSISNWLSPADLKMPSWIWGGTLRSGFGYKDNVTMSSGNPRGSPFWSVAADGMAYHLPTADGWQFYGMASFENVGYLDQSIGVANEQMGMVVGLISKELGHDWKTGLGVNYIYQDQVVDLSVTQTNAAGTTNNSEVLGNNVSARWFVRKDLKPWWAEAEVSLARQWLVAPLDGYYQTGPKLTLGRTYGHGSDVTLAYSWYYVDFDHREQITAEGYSDPGTRLRFYPQTVELAWHHIWDQKAHWHTLAKAGFDLNEDNGSGYFDFTQYRLSEQIKYHAPTWEAWVQFRAGHFDFPIQPVSVDDPTRRYKTVFSLSLRAEKNLSKAFKVFVNYSLDHSLANVSYDRYQTSATSAGVEYHF